MEALSGRVLQAQRFNDKQELWLGQDIINHTVSSFCVSCQGDSHLHLTFLMTRTPALYLPTHANLLVASHTHVYVSRTHFLAAEGTWTGAYAYVE